MHTLMRKKQITVNPNKYGLPHRHIGVQPFTLSFIFVYTHTCMHAYFGLHEMKTYVPVSFFVYHSFLNKMLCFRGALNLLNFAALNLLVLYPFPLWLVLPSSSPKTRIYVFYFLILYINMF